MDDFGGATEEFPELDSSGGMAPVELELISDVVPVKRRRTGLMLGVLGAVATVGAVGIMALPNKAEGYRLAEAQSATRAAGSINFEMTVETDALPDPITSTGVIDQVSKRMSMSMDMAAALGVPGEIEMVMDMPTLVAYMKMPAGDGVPADMAGRWLKMNLGEMAAQGGGVDVSKLGGGDPTQALDSLDKLGEVTEVGFEELDGEKVKHFDVQTDLREIYQSQGAVLDGTKLEQLLDKVGGTQDMQVWVDEENRVRKMEFSLDLDGLVPGAGLMKYTIRYTGFGETATITLPNDAEALDLMELMSQGLES
jgi:hypothetical protein